MEKILPSPLDRGGGAYMLKSMNIFALAAWPDGSPNYFAAGALHDDSRVLKMALEAAQVAHTVLHDWRDSGCYRPTHAHHPITRWAASSPSNLQQVITYGLGCLQVAERRARKPYLKHRRALEWALRRLPDVRGADATEQPQCMPEEFRRPDLVTAYRALMASKKQRWTSAADRIAGCGPR